jgi:histidinol-phosphate aminotransferase
MADDGTHDLAEHRLRRSDAAVVDLADGQNPYGPPPAVIDALHALTADDVGLPPRDAADRLATAYAEVLGVDSSQLLAGRGPAEFLRLLGRLVPHQSVAVPLPAWGEVLDVFPSRGFSRFPGEQQPSIEQLDEALDTASLVVISNPSLATGVILERTALEDAARRHPAATLVVDETAVDFLLDPAAVSLVGTDADNVVVLRSTAEFYGTAAARTGVAWSADPQLLRSLFGHREALPISGLDVVVAEAALADAGWADDVRRHLAADIAWLDAILPALGGRQLADARLPYRYVVTDSAVEWATRLASAGISVRTLGPGHGVHPGALWISSPRETERPVVASVLGAPHAVSPAFSEAG